MRRGDLVAVGQVEMVRDRSWGNTPAKEMMAKPRIYLNSSKELDELLYPPGYYSLPKEAADLMLRGMLKVIQPAIEKALAERFDVEEVKVRFSAKAGCKCGCSPGFILESVIPGFRYADAWVDLFPASNLSN